VSNWYYGYLGVRQNKSLIGTIFYYLLILDLIDHGSILLKRLGYKVNKSNNKCGSKEIVFRS